jgi:hypothetical protein
MWGITFTGVRKLSSNFVSLYWVAENISLCRKLCLPEGGRLTCWHEIKRNYNNIIREVEILKIDIIMHINLNPNLTLFITLKEDCF